MSSEVASAVGSAMVEVHVNFPSAEEAATVSREAVERRLAACANIHAAVHSFYWWDGAVQSEDEIPVVFKTSDASAEALIGFVAGRHSYDVPGIVIHPVNANAPYLAWLDRETEAGRK